jgi:hypothetical protein
VKTEQARKWLIPVGVVVVVVVVAAAAEKDLIFRMFYS